MTISTEINRKTLWVWDGCSEPDSFGEAFVYRWDSYKQDNLSNSIPKYVELNSDRLRAKYLAFIHELGETLVDDKNLIEKFVLDDGFSYWWMSLFVEKSSYKSPITSALRIFALEEIVSQKKPQLLRFTSSNKILHQILFHLCNELGIVYEWIRIPSKPKEDFSWFRRLYSYSPQPFQALIGFSRYLFTHWRLNKVKNVPWFSDINSLFLCSYFLGVSTKKTQTSNFYSQYWTDLHNVMNNIGLTENWVHHFNASYEIPNAASALDMVNDVNEKSGQLAKHTFVDSFLSWSVVFRVLKLWVRLMLRARSIKNVKVAFQPSGSKISFWPLFKKDWDASIYGPVAIDNLRWLVLFDDILSEVPKQSKGLYLCENQAWERALIHAWRKCGHGQLIAVVHSTVRYWDLRYFTDSRTLNSTDNNALPQADLIALNGEKATNAYINAGYPQEFLVGCEALRYTYLKNYHINENLHKTQKSGIKLLILSDYLSVATLKMLELLVDSIELLNSTISYTIKPHPNYLVKAENYQSLNLTVINDPLDKVLHNYDVVYASNMTSAALDAYCAGLPVIVMLDDETLNYSPLRGQDDVIFVSNAEEMARALEKNYQDYSPKAKSSDFFFLDSNFPRWKSLISPEAV